MSRTLPKGSKVYFNGNDYVLTRDINQGDIPREDDFYPIIPNGTEIEKFKVYNSKGTCIYSHPYFLVHNES